MNWLNFFILSYIFFSVFVSFYASRRIQSSKDYVMAGRHLPLPIATATIIASWFGASSVLGSAGKFIKSGLPGVLVDPFSAAFCLIIIALFYAKKLYNCQTMTIGDFFHRHYGKNVSILFSLFSAITYIGWIAAQIQAFGIIVHVLSAGSVSPALSIIFSSTIVVLYTIFGGMWSVALTDFLQTTIIICSMVVLSFVVFQHISLGELLHHAQAAGKLTLFEGKTHAECLAIVASFFCIPFGLVSQQDVFQRINAAKTERVVVQSSLLASVLYVLLGLCPILFGYAATIISPQWAQNYINTDPQLVLPEFALRHLPFFARVLFFGAIVSGIMGTASAGLLASSVIVTKNLIDPIFHLKEDDRFLLIAIRCVSVAIGLFIIIFNLFSKKMIFDIIINAFSITFVFVFMPFNISLFWPERAHRRVAYASVITAAIFWIGTKLLYPALPSALLGLLGSAVGCVIGIGITWSDKKVFYKGTLQNA